MSFGFNPQTQVGNLNRVATHLVVPAFPQLSVTAANMSKSLIQVTFEGPATDQIETATNIVNSPRAFVMATAVVNLLRSQIISAQAWLLQYQANTQIGLIDIFSDAPTTLQSIPMVNCSITEIDPGAFDGQDPTFKATVKGTFYVNAAIWATLTGASVVA